MAVSPDGTRIYVTDGDSGRVSVIDTATNQVIATLGVGRFAYGVAVSPDGTRAYVTDGDSGRVSVVDTATNQVIATLGVGRFTYGVAVSPDGTRAYVTSGTNSVSVINTATHRDHRHHPRPL